jgi:MFS family permease
VRADVKLIALSLLGGITWGLAWSVLAPYLRSLGYSGAEYGAMGGISVVTSALFTMAGGFLSDVLGARRVMALSLPIWSGAVALISTGDKLLVTLGFLLNGVAGGLGWTSQQALVARSGRDEELHYIFSYVAAANTLGGAMGSFMGWLPVIASSGYGIPLIEAYRMTLEALSILPLLGIPLALGVREEGVTGAGVPRLATIKRLGRRFYYVAAAEMIIGFGAAMSIHNIDYYFAAKYGVTSAELGSVLGVEQLIMAALMVKIPSIADRYGGILKVYLAVTSSSIPLLVAMTFTGDYYVAASLYIIRTVLMNVANPLFNAFVMRQVPRDLRGVASAFLSLSWTIPAGGGRAVGGYLLDLNLELPLRLTALLYGLALGWLASVFRDELGRGIPAAEEKEERAAAVTG